LPRNRRVDSWLDHETKKGTNKIKIKKNERAGWTLLRRRVALQSFQELIKLVEDYGVLLGRHGMLWIVLVLQQGDGSVPLCRQVAVQPGHVSLDVKVKLAAVVVFLRE